MSSHSHETAERALIVAIVLTAVTMVLEVIGGWLSGSLSLLSDAGHMLRDVVALVISLTTLKLADRLPTHTRTFGYHRLEIFSAFLNGLVLVALSGWILVSAFQRIAHPQPIRGGLMFGVALEGLVVNLYNAFALHKSHDLNVRSAFLHVLTDTLASVGVIVASIWILVTGQVMADSIVGFAIGVIVLFSSFGVIAESVRILLEFVPKGIRLADIIEQMETVKGVTCVYDIHLWSLCSNINLIDAHVVCHEPDLKRTEQIKEDLRAVLARFNIRHSTLEFEFGDLACKALFDQGKVKHVPH